MSFTIIPPSRPVAGHSAPTPAAPYNSAPLRSSRFASKAGSSASGNSPRPARVTAPRGSPAPPWRTARRAWHCGRAVNERVRRVRLRADDFLSILRFTFLPGFKRGGCPDRSRLFFLQTLQPLPPHDHSDGTHQQYGRGHFGPEPRRKDV